VPRSLLLRCCALLFATSLIVSCASTANPRPAPVPELPRGEGPSLVVLLVVDQLRGDYLDRFRPVLNGGLAWLIDHGATYTEGHQNHAMTATAPGHATIATGVEPSLSGIIGNTWFNRETGFQEYSAGRSRSPVNLKVTALGDWIKAADPRSKVFTASAKDRSAVMLGGQRPDGAYWYGRSDGTWLSSSYYTDAERPWLEAFNDQDWLRRYRGLAWEPILGPEHHTALDIVDLDLGAMPSGFPHALGSFSAHSGLSFYNGIYGTPFVDAYLGEFAKAIVDNEDLGLDGSPDLLAVSFSALDSVGHAYGPDSPEVLDVIVRLDAVLGDLIDHLDEAVGLEHIVFALSADHGVVTYPEVRQLRGQTGRRLGAVDVVCVQQAGVQLSEEFGDKPWLSDGFYLDREFIIAEGLDPAVMAARLAALVSGCEAVERAWTDAEIAALPETGGTPLEQLYRNNYVPGLGADVVLQLRENYLYNGTGLGTTHGSPYHYDSWVAMLFAGVGVEKARIDRRVATVDIAPTLAAWLGIAPPPHLHGVDLGADFRPE
jgi:predicted AlkP superfamily pyrophosphatase or phosphodiesterase